MIPRSVAAALLVSLAAFPAAAGAQGEIARADSLFARGRVFAAESLYYLAVRTRPRDPSARLALGRYLAARGALKVGAVLMQEARYFGGNRGAIAESLVPVYTLLGDWQALATLPESPLSGSELARAEWLREHPPGVRGADSTTVPWLPGAGQLGAIPLIVGSDTVLAMIDPAASALVADTSWGRRSDVRRFASRRDADPLSHVAVVRQVRIGDLALDNVPARFAPVEGGGVRIGLVALARLAPTFDRLTGQATFRRDGQVADTLAGVRYPTLTYPTGMLLISAEGVWPIPSETAERALAGMRWTIDPKRGRVVVERE